MGRRGPRPDPDQAAKGWPGRRKSKAEKAAEESARIAALLAPLVGPAAELPPMLQDAKFAPAAAVWRKLAPELRRTHRLPPEAEFGFIQFCIYAQEWVEATDDLHTRGFVQNIQTVAGGKMERRRPKTIDRQQAFSNCQDLSVRYGLTPTDLYSLFKAQRIAVSENPDLFGQDRKQPPAPEAQQTPGRIGSLARHASTPPPLKH